MELDPPPDLGRTKRDITMAVLRGAFGVAPVVGQGLAELLDYLIPTQRVERIETYLRYLAARLAALEESKLRSRLRDPESIDLFEDGCLQAARALSDERQQQIAKLVADGIADEATSYIESKRVLLLLRELDDAEIIVLGAYLPENRMNDYRDRHAHVLREPVRGYRAPSIGSPQQEKDRYTAHRAGTVHLLRLGLLEERQREGARPDVQLSDLGRLLLRRIGIANR